jgi:hypothetical protein
LLCFPQPHWQSLPPASSDPRWLPGPRGKRLAELWCSACHVVTVNQRQANPDAPPFEEIAKRQNFSEPGLVTFMLDLMPRCRT